AAATVIESSTQPAHVVYAVDATAAYAPDAGLKQWIRRLESTPDSTSVLDRFVLNSDSGEIVHVIWMTQRPEVQQRGDEAILTTPALTLRITGAPAEVQIIDLPVEQERLLSFAEGTVLYRVEAKYRVTGGELTLETAM